MKVSRYTGSMMMQRIWKIHTRPLACGALALLLVFTGCATPPPKPESVPPAATPAPKPPPVAQPAATTPPVKPPSPPIAAGGVFRAAAWSDLPGWRDDPLSEAWTALLGSCSAIGARETWREACAAASRMQNPTAEAARRYFETHFTPHQVTTSDGADEGLATGYYEPLLRGSRKPSARYRYALYGVPDDLLVVDLGTVHPELKNMRLRGRLEGRRIVPYYDRSQIENGPALLRGKEIAWVDDAVDLFFLHVQGSGRILLESGDTMRVGYAEHNGYPYRSIGRLLVERGELALEQASMQGIKAWARQHPERLNKLLNSNASYVFFRELPATVGGPPGALGVPLTARRSIAVDPQFVPLGAPVFISTTWPSETRPLNRLTLAQDTGTAIRGAVRADFFWGYGETAAREAGRMKQRLRMWILWPQGQPVPASGS